MLANANVKAEVLIIDNAVWYLKMLACANTLAFHAGHINAV